jgi:mRNA interferase RelE/StbE
MMNEPRQRPYDVQLTDAALKNLRRYPAPDQRRILARIEQLAADPQTMPNVKRLVDFDVAYRLRVGKYRILFERDDIIRIIDVIDILPRGRVYRRK